MRLIAYAQNGVEVSEASLQQNIAAQLPRFQGIQTPQPAIHESKIASQATFTSPIVSPAHQPVQTQFFQDHSLYELASDQYQKFDQYYST
jgi:hypothetical protein